ncbi:hypothetical protein ACJX0J_016082, partial [Zea mays]
QLKTQRVDQKSHFGWGFDQSNYLTSTLWKLYFDGSTSKEGQCIGISNMNLYYSVKHVEVFTLAWDSIIDWVLIMHDNYNAYGTLTNLDDWRAPIYFWMSTFEFLIVFATIMLGLAVVPLKNMTQNETAQFIFSSNTTSIKLIKKKIEDYLSSEEN